MESLYIRKFETQILSECKNIIWSRYFPKPMVHALFHEDIKNEHYILCPIYSNGDTQVGVTGTIGTSETYDKGMIREIGEEIGLSPSQSVRDVHFITVKKVPNKNQNISVYIASIDNLKPLNESDHDFKFTTQGRDDRTKKVGCIVYGEKTKMIEYLNRTKIFRYYSQDDIVGIVTLSVKDAREYIVRMNKTNYDEICSSNIRR